MTIPVTRERSKPGASSFTAEQKAQLIKGAWSAIFRHTKQASRGNHTLVLRLQSKGGRPASLCRMVCRRNSK